MNRKDLKPFFLGVVLTSLVFAAGICLFKFIGFGITSTTYSVGTKANYLESYIQNYNWKNVSNEKLETAALKGMITALNDKYAAYYTQEEYDEEMSSIQGVYTGLGIAVSQKDNGDVYVADVFEGSPAKAAGILKGDVMTSINNTSVKSMKWNEVTVFIRKQGEKTINLVLNRDGKEVSVSVSRQKIKKVSVNHSMLDNQIGYISIREFDDETPKQFKDALADLEAKKQKSLIIDLRDNGGGSLTAVLDMLDRMLPKGILLTVKSKNNPDEVYKAKSDECFTKPCAILINGNSASASEVFAGAMQDRGNATLVGVKSYGKGIVQSVFSLKNEIGGGAIKLTTGEYFLPSGRSIHQIGLTPDRYVKYTGDTTHYSREKDNQLKAAMEVLKK